MKNHLYCSSPQTPPPFFLPEPIQWCARAQRLPPLSFSSLVRLIAAGAICFHCSQSNPGRLEWGGGRVTLSLLMDTAVGLRSKPARVPPWEVAEGEEPGALVGHPRRGRSGLVCVKPLHRVGKYNNMFGFFLFFFLKTRVYNPFLLTLYNLLICYSKPFFFFLFGDEGFPWINKSWWFFFPPICKLIHSSGELAFVKNSRCTVQITR